MNTAEKSEIRGEDISWSLLLTIAGVFVASLFFLSHNVYYTEGEVCEALFARLVWVVAAFVLIGLYRRTTALWSITVFGGLLLVWQTYQAHKWAIIHEDVVGIVHFVENTKRDTGRYPTNLDGYPFQTRWVKSHIFEYAIDDKQGFRLLYFMNNPGTTYWYYGETGFGYFPD